MPARARPVALALLALGVLLTAASADEPKEPTGDAKKLVGKWEAAGVGTDAFKDKANMYMDFKGDGSGRMVVDFTDAELKKFFGDKGLVITFRWKVSGAKLELSEVKAADPKLQPAKKDKDKESMSLKFDGNDKVLLTPLDEKDAKTLTLTRTK